MSMSALEQLGSFVAGYRPDARAREAVRLHAADTVGAWIAATDTDEGRALLRFRDAGGGQLVDRLATNCALVRMSEIDDIHLASMVTPGSIAVPAALTIAAALPNVTTDELTAAIATSYEAMIRLGVAIDGPSALYRGIWPTYFAAPFGVAAAAARLFKLDETQTAHALVLALIFAAPGVGHHTASTTARWLAVGNAAGRGLNAALAAQGGFTSDLKLADGDFLKGIYGVTPNVAALGQGWGELALHQVSFKPWCAARQTMAATQALQDVLANGMAANDITRIEVAVLPPHRKMIDHGVTAGDRFSHLTSVQYNMAVAALSPEAAYSINPPAGVVTPALQSLMCRIEVQSDEALLAGYPKIWSAEVGVTTNSGRFQQRVTDVPGDPLQPFGESELKAKFARFNGGRLGTGTDAMFGRALAALEQPAALLCELEAP